MSKLKNAFFLKILEIEETISHPMHKLIFCFFVFLLPLAATTQESKVQAAQSSVPSVLVSLAPYAYLVKKISNDTVSVHTLIPLNADPHLFEPTPKQIEDVSRTRLWFRVGEPFEKKLLTVLKQRTPSLKDVPLWESVPSLLPTHECHHSEDSHHCHHHEDKDLHIWLSPKLVIEQARAIAKALIEFVPEHKQLYETNLRQLVKDLEALDLEIATTLAPLKGQAILVSHPALGYFCKEYGLIQLSIETEGKDPLPQAVAQTVEAAKTLHVRRVFAQAQHNNKGAQLIAKQLALPLHTIDPYSADVIENMRALALLIADSHD